MFIELTDALRCPVDHPEQYLVLLPDEVVDRSVVLGELGCPVCGATYRIRNGIVGLGRPPEVTGSGTALTAEAAHALLGLSGPGGYLILVGGATLFGDELAVLLEGVHLVALNPPSEVSASAELSVVEAGRIPLKVGSVRGVLLGAGYGSEPVWQDEAYRVVLPGLRVVGEGSPPQRDGWETLGNAEGVWVARRK